MNNSVFDNTQSPPHDEGATPSSVWKSCLEFIRESLKPLTFKTWFEPLVPKDLDGALLTVEVPSTYFYEWLEEHYFDLIQSSVRNVLGPEARLQYAVKVPDAGMNLFSPETVTDSHESGNASGGGIPVPEINNTSGLRGTNLNPKFTFDNFIRGDGNQFARAAALNVANNPGETAFNPLVLYGGVGLGKTHLVQAIGNAIQKSNSEKQVFYVSSEKFTIDFVESIEKNRTTDFSNFYRNMDVLIVDDIQFFSGKERTQDTFFQTFNTLHLLKKQIILSSDRPPKELRGLNERMISRFQCGLTVDIQPPDLETRIAILRMKAESDQITLPQEVVEYIASNVKSNIRELEGCYISIVARHTLENCPIDVSLARTVLNHVITPADKDITVEQIQKMIADHFKISEKSLRAKTRKQEIVVPRQIAMYLTKKNTTASLKTIGMYFGGRDHTTIIHACRSVEKMLEDDEKIRSHIIQLEKRLSYMM